MDNSDIQVTVISACVPTTAQAFHESVTHVDVLGMPTAFSKLIDINGNDLSFVEGLENSAFHPTPCCGASATTWDDASGSYIVCKSCYENVDPAFGNIPMQPLQEW